MLLKVQMIDSIEKYFYLFGKCLGYYQDTEDFFWSYTQDFWGIL